MYNNNDNNNNNIAVETTIFKRKGVEDVLR